MQRLIISIFIIVFFGFAVFGLSFMAHQEGGTHTSCLADSAFNTACPQNIGAFPMIDLHFVALSNFSSATFSGLPDMGMLVFLSALLIVLFGSPGMSFLGGFFLLRRYAFNITQSASHRQLTEWLALHNKGDALTSLRS